MQQTIDYKNTEKGLKPKVNFLFMTEIGVQAFSVNIVARVYPRPCQDEKTSFFYFFMQVKTRKLGKNRTQLIKDVNFVAKTLTFFSTSKTKCYDCLKFNPF